VIPRRKRLPAFTLLAATASLLLSCTAAINFRNPDGPRYADCYTTAAPRAADAVGPSPAGDELRVVTFNIKFAKKIDKAIQLLERTPALASADLILLQEMDEEAVQRIAAARSMCYVYYPATIAPSTHRHFGPAILSRWPLTDDRKLVLPHVGRFRKTARIAVAATMQVGDTPIRVYSVHVATGIEVGPRGRREQVLALLADADGPYERVIVGGDLNAKGLGRLFVARGYTWPTRDLGRTSKFADVDHVFLRGLALERGTSVGKVRDNLGSSDHNPVWAAVLIPPQSPR
jgi:endonuclease/exonuclease/phosphatase family metal-dependent hydrolase